MDEADTVAANAPEENDQPTCEESVAEAAVEEESVTAEEDVAVEEEAAVAVEEEAAVEAESVTAEEDVAVEEEAAAKEEAETVVESVTEEAAASTEEAAANTEEAPNNKTLKLFKMKAIPPNRHLRCTLTQSPLPSRNPNPSKCRLPPNRQVSF